jgi:hypothetical protein
MNLTFGLVWSYLDKAVKRRVAAGPTRRVLSRRRSDERHPSSQVYASEVLAVGPHEIATPN